MATSTVDVSVPGAVSLDVTDDTLTADLSDGRRISVPLAWYPRLVHATPEERNNYELWADGVHFHWPDLDEDLGVEGLLAGRKSGESPRSFQRWLEAKKAGRPLTLDALMEYERSQNKDD